MLISHPSLDICKRAHLPSAHRQPRLCSLFSSHHQLPVWLEKTNWWLLPPTNPGPDQLGVPHHPPGGEVPTRSSPPLRTPLSPGLKEHQWVGPPKTSQWAPPIPTDVPGGGGPRQISQQPQTGQGLVASPLVCLQGPHPSLPGMLLLSVHRDTPPVPPPVFSGPVPAARGTHLCSPNTPPPFFWSFCLF